VTDSLKHTPWLTAQVVSNAGHPPLQPTCTAMTLSTPLPGCKSCAIILCLTQPNSRPQPTLLATNTSYQLHRGIYYHQVLFHISELQAANTKTRHVGCNRPSRPTYCIVGHCRTKLARQACLVPAPFRGEGQCKSSKVQVRPGCSCKGRRQEASCGKCLPHIVAARKHELT